LPLSGSEAPLALLVLIYVCYYGCYTVLLTITFMEVASVVVGTVAVTALHGTHAITFLGFFY